MAEVLIQFEGTIEPEDGPAYIARVCGRELKGGSWEGWVEFAAVDGTAVLRTTRETTQPNRRDLDYWATGLTRAYLEGALERARKPRKPPASRWVDAAPYFEGPAPHPEPTAAPAAGTPARTSPADATAPADTIRPAYRPHGVLNPFRVYQQGERVLRRELGALDADHLRDIVREHDLMNDRTVQLDDLQKSALEEIILAAARGGTT